MKILFYGLGCVGDAVMCTPVLERLSEVYPSATMDLILDSRSASLFDHFPLARQRFVIHQYCVNAQKVILGRFLGLRQYDLYVECRNNEIFRQLVRAKHKWIPKIGHESSDHKLESIFTAVANHLGSTIPAPKIWLSSRERRTANRLLREREGSRILAIAPGSRKDVKIWMPENFAALASSLNDHFDCIVILGSRKEISLSKRVARQIQGIRVRNLTGRLSLLETAAVLGRGHYFIGNDSGLGHVASAMGKKTFTIFGIGDPSRFRPWGPHARYLIPPSNNINSLEPAEVRKAVVDHLMGPTIRPHVSHLEDGRFEPEEASAFPSGRRS